MKATSEAGHLRVVVVVPVYNHAGAVGGVLQAATALGLPIVVVDDGSTDDTRARLEAFCSADCAAAVTLVRHGANAGKAAALRTGFEAAAGLGATHAATIDADGQLSPADIPVLLAAAAEHPRALVLGVRPRLMDGCPRHCRAGRGFAGLAVFASTGLRLSDTQCGLRVYPLDLVQRVRCAEGRYAFEAEVITRAHRAGYGVVEVPVHCRYFTGVARVSHYRPWRDTVAQVWLHARLIVQRFLPWPRSGAPPSSFASPRIV